MADAGMQFETHEWSLEPEGGEKVSLLQGNDPFQQATADKITVTT